MRNRIQGVLALLSAVALGVTLVGVAPAASAKPKPPKTPKTQVANFTIDVVGYLEVAQFHDTTADCTPGIRYTQTNRVSVETGQPVAINLTLTTQPFADPLITSRFTKPSGSAIVTGELSNQKTTNVCEGTPQTLDSFPNCTSTSGTFGVQFLPNEDSSGNVTPLNGQALTLGLARFDGDMADPTCTGAGADRILGPNNLNLMIMPSTTPGLFAVLPTGLRTLPLFKAPKGTVFKRYVTVTGPCSGVTVYDEEGAGDQPPPFTLNADGDCSMRGHIVITLKRK